MLNVSLTMTNLWKGEPLCMYRNTKWLEDEEEIKESFPDAPREPRTVYTAMRIIYGSEGERGFQVVLYAEQLDRRRIWLDRVCMQRYSEVPYYRQRGWRRRYPTLARIREFQEKEKDVYREAVLAMYACPCRSCEGDGGAEPEVLPERRGLPGDWMSLAPWEVGAFEPGDTDPEGQQG